MTKQILVGGVAVGGGAPVTIQSMTNTKTEDVSATVSQILRLEQAGCEIVRASVYNEAAAQAIPAIRERIHIPLVADIHFDYRLALASIEAGVDKLRFNPGNIGSEAKVRLLADCARAHHVPIRIGVNSGSVEKELLQKYGGPTVEALAESALKHVEILEKAHFYEIAVSAKASSVRDTVAVYQLLHEKCPYPLHIGVTEAGGDGIGLVKGSIGIGALLLMGIGDTLRVSLTGDPVQEAEAGRMILEAVGLRHFGVEVVSCPTCGRTPVDLYEITQRVKRELTGSRYLRVAVMGCVVNGPGEAREADIGIAFGPTGGAVFKRGEVAFTAPLNEVVDRFIEEAKRMQEA